MSRRGNKIDGEFYERWDGKRTVVSDIITTSEVDLLEEVVAPFALDEVYCGPPLGTRHVYAARRVPKVSGHDAPDWLVEHRRLQRQAVMLERDRLHALAMALDQAERERLRYRAPVPAGELPARRTRSVALTVYCESCAHRGQVMITPQMHAPYRLRCSQCDALQEL